MGKEKIIDIKVEERGTLTGDVSDLGSIDSVELYLRSMAAEPLLKAEEEVALAKQIENGRKSVDKLSKANSEEEREKLMGAIEEGLQARYKLARANGRLVVSIAKKYASVMLIADLIQDGNLGLMRAVDKYEWRTGNRFSTYASWWIRQGITRGIAQKSRVLRLPFHQNEKLNVIKSVMREVESRGEAIDYEEVARVVNERIENGRVDALEIKKLLDFDGVVSLNAKANDESDDELGEGLMDESEAGPGESWEVFERKEALRVLLDKLPDRLGMILRLRFGLIDGETRTLEEIGVMYEVSRERVRQLEKEAMRKMREMMEGEVASDWLLE